MLIPLGDEKMALQLSLVRCSSCVIYKARRRCEGLGLLARPHVMEVHRLTRAPEPPGQGVVRVRRLVRGLKLSEADALVAGPDPQVEGVIGVPVDAAIPRARMASRLHCGGAISVGGGSAR
jgi:hypothetical protein